MYAWGWRLPFLIGLPLGIIGWLIRYKINESEVFNSAKAKEVIYNVPIKQIIKFNLTNLIAVIILFSLSTTFFYISFLYVATYLVKINKITLHESLINNEISILILIFLIPIFGYISDKISRRLIIFSGAFCILVFSYPIFILFLINKQTLLIGQLLSSLFLAMLVGPMAATISEVFSTFTRYSGVSAGLNFGASLFGGTCPLIITYLVQYSGNDKIPAFYIIFFAFSCLFAIKYLKINQNFS